MRNLKYYVACSVDGFIAHEDGSWNGFLPDGDHVTDYLDSLKNFDAVLMGRKTYEIGLKEGKTDPYPTMDSYVFSRSLKEILDENVTLVTENTAEVVKNLKNRPGKDIYLCGGAELASILFAENLIDEIILKVNPFLMGTGIPLFSGTVDQTQLNLIDTKKYENGVLKLCYKVHRGIRA